MGKRAGIIALLCAIGGLVASVAAGYVHYRMLHDPTYTSFCDINATFSCTEVYSSRFGSFMGLPVALFGAIWFGFALLLAAAWVTARPAVGESVPGYLFAGSTLALAVVLYLGYASFVILKHVCPLCVATYVATIGIFLSSGAAASLPMLSLPKRAIQDLRLLVATPIALVLALVWAGSSVSTLAFFPRETATVMSGYADASAAAAGEPQQSELERYMASSPRVPLAVPNDGAKVLIVKFADYQCPACGQAYTAYKPILEKYAVRNPGAVKMVMKDFPLSNACNPTMRSELHPAACQAAVAMRLARAKDEAKADKLEEWLYTHQQEMSPATVKQKAQEIAGVTDFDARYAATIALVKGDITLAQSLKVSQTPTFFINGVKVEGAWAPQYFDQAIAFELKRAQ